MTTAGPASGPVVTVTPNPAVDLTYSVSGIRAGHSHRVPGPLTRAGGKGINVARVVHNSGRPAVAVTMIGGQSEIFTSELAVSGLASRLVRMQAPMRRTMAFVDSVDGETSIFNEQGTPLRASEWEALRIAVEQELFGAGCVVGSGSLPGRVQEGFYPWLITRAANLSVPCIVDTSGPGLMAAARAGADVLKPNHHELMEATDTNDVDSAANIFLNLGVKRLFVSCGAAGMRLYCADDRSTIWLARLPEPLSGNPTGAGDAAVAAIAVLIAEGISDPAATLRQAVAWSAAAVLMPAAGEIHPHHKELADQVQISKIPFPHSTQHDETEHSR